MPDEPLHILLFGDFSLRCGAAPALHLLCLFRKRSSLRLGDIGSFVLCGELVLLQLRGKTLLPHLVHQPRPQAPARLPECRRVVLPMLGSNLAISPLTETGNPDTIVVSLQTPRLYF